MNALLALLLLAAQEKKKDAVDFEKDVRPLLQKYCFSCHGPEKKKGDVDLTLFKTGKDVLAKADFWQRAVERLNAFEMPPAKSPQPGHDEKALINRWHETLPRKELDCRTLATDRSQRFYRGYVMSRRLNRTEYGNSVRDLIGLAVRPEEFLPADGSGGEGFDTNGDTLFTSPILVEKYLEAADRALEAVLPERGGALSIEARAARERILGAGTSREAARKAVGEFARRAFRRPVDPAEVDRHLALYDRARKRGDAHEASLRLALKGVLVSPHFLFLPEPEPPEEGVVRLAPYPLASRISYFLWSAPPDEELLRLAGEGKLHEPAVLKEQVRRMLRDPRSRELGENFALQWLELEALGRAVRPDPKKFPEFDEAMAASMKAEVVHLFHRIFREDRNLLEFIDCDYTYVDARLAKLYGLPEVKGPGLQLVTFTDRRRGGLLGMAGVHAVTSFPLRTSPVIRGKWILEALLGSKVPPPPPNVITLSEDDPAHKGLTLRQRLEKHRANPDCASCHDRMDPLGFGLENFDPLGRWRTDEEGLKIDAGGKLPSGERFAGVVELKQILLKRKDDVLSHLTRKLLGYALGRALNKFDQCVVDDALKAVKADGTTSSALLETIVLSYPFQHRYVKK